VRQQQHQQEQQRAAIVSKVSLAEVREIEDMEFQQESAAGSSAGLPSGNVKVGSNIVLGAPLAGYVDQHQ
jgi:hypothetical protein